MSETLPLVSWKLWANWFVKGKPILEVVLTTSSTWLTARVILTYFAGQASIYGHFRHSDLDVVNIKAN